MKIRSYEERMGYIGKPPSQLKVLYSQYIGECEFRMRNNDFHTSGDYGYAGTEYIRERRYARKLGAWIAKTKLVKNGELERGREIQFLTQVLNAGRDVSRYYYQLATRFVPGNIEMRRAALEKFDSGEWQQVPWHNESWFQESPYADLHMLHISENNPANVAFCENYDKFQRNLYTSVKPGRYLTRFFGDVLSEGDIRRWAEKCASRALPAELHFIAHDDKQGWIGVYRDGPASCMSQQKCVHVYAHAHSVLRLAFLQQGASITARCIVREDTDPKQYIRVYPNTDSAENQMWHSRLKDMLEDRGYVHGNMQGVLLDVEEDGDEYTVPYIDSGNTSRSRCCVALFIKNGMEFLRIGSDGTEACSTSGTMTLYEGEECSECGDHYPDDEIHYVDLVEQHVCNNCIENHFTNAITNGRGHTELVRNDDAIYCASDGDYYTEDGAYRCGIHQCEVTGDFYTEDDLVATSRGWVHTDRAVALHVDDDAGNSFAIQRDTVETHDGRMIHKDCAKAIDGKVYHADDEVEAEQEQTEKEGE